jgi:16S rRNA processing protein RimM
MDSPESNLLNVGRITTVYGVKGWVKIHSQTEPAENIFSYHPWFIKTRHGVKSVVLKSWKPHGKGFVAQLSGVDDRSQAESLCPVDIAIEKSTLAELDEGDFYWHQLQGLRVISSYDDKTYNLGIITRIMPTGANDVLVVVGDDQSIDQSERLIPYVLEQFVTEVDIDAGTIRVVWDPEF